MQDKEIGTTLSAVSACNIRQLGQKDKGIVRIMPKNTFLVPYICVCARVRAKRVPMVITGLCGKRYVPIDHRLNGIIRGIS